MNFDKMKLGKRGVSSVVSSMTELMIVIIVVAVMSFIVITMIIVFAPLVQDKAAEGANQTTIPAVASLYNIFATEGIFEILAVSVYLLIVVIVLLVLIVNATKGIKK